MKFICEIWYTSIPREEISECQSMFRKWKGSGEVDLSLLRDIIKRERHLYESGVLKCSAGLLTEIRAEQKKVGHWCKLAGF